MEYFSLLISEASCDILMVMETQNIDALTPEQAAKLLGVSVVTIRSAVRDKRLDARPACGILIPREALEEYRRRTQPHGEKRVGRPRKQETINA